MFREGERGRENLPHLCFISNFFVSSFLDNLFGCLPKFLVVNFISAENMKDEQNQQERRKEQKNEQDKKGGGRG